jgi:branched-chain amino acid transport system substrate-binding protein
MQRMTRRVFLSLILIMSLAPFASAQRRRVAPATDFHVIHLGALFSLSGDGASLGAASAAALELAVRDINEELRALRVPYHVEFSVEDTQLTPAVALQKIQLLHARGARFVLGPQSSAEAGAVLSFANANRMVVISQGSTASSLAIPGDALFRFAPNDKLEGVAQAALAWADGIETLVPMWRADAGNTGLHNSTKASFEALGGVMYPGISYDPATTSFTSQVAALGAAVRAVRAQQPAAKVAVYLASFEEAVDIFRLARLDPDLAAVRWYGGDGVTQSRALVDDATVASFGALTSFTSPNVGLDAATRDRWEPLSNEIRQRIGFVPDAYALSVYDAAWVAVLAAVEVENDEERLREAFARNVQRHYGVTGSTALDANGDRKTGSFDFWTIRAANGTWEWVRTAQFSSGRLSR